MVSPLSFDIVQTKAVQPIDLAGTRSTLNKNSIGQCSAFEQDNERTITPIPVLNGTAQEYARLPGLIMRQSQLMTFIASGGLCERVQKAGRWDRIERRREQA